jgi:hypothetical protein
MMASADRVTQLTFLAIVATLIWAGGASSDEPAIGWQLDLSGPAAAAKIISDKSMISGKNGEPLDSPFSVTVADGALRLAGTYQNVVGSDYVRVQIPMPNGGVDFTKYPVLEVEWRSSAGKPAGTLLVQVDAQTSKGEDATSYYYPPQGGSGEWVTSVNPYVPDAGFPTRGTPTRLTMLEFCAYAHGLTGEHTLEIRSFRVRGYTAEEAAADARRVPTYRNFKHVPIPEPWATKVFPYGMCASCRGPEGYESWYDNVVRSHGTLNVYQTSLGKDWYGFSAMAPVDEFIAARRRELAAAAPRGLYICPAVGFAGYMKDKGPDGLPWLKTYAEALAGAFHDEPYLAGWFVADEVSDDFLWGIAATNDALNRSDHSKINVVNHFGISRILRYEPYLNIVMTDHYPILDYSHDPWSVGRWCREMDGKSDRPHWIFLPAFGKSDWFKADCGYVYPTRAEVRLVTYLALANGAKGISQFTYSMPSQFVGVFDTIGNALPLDNPIVQDISAIGEKLAEVGPFLLRTKLMPKDAATATGDAGDRPLSVGVRRMKDGSAFLIVVNESVEKSQGGEVSFSKGLISKDRRAYDLYSLAEVAGPGSVGFTAAPLIPGDGRIYFVGTPAQFARVRREILHNRALEILRIANLDLLVARRWGDDVRAIDRQFEAARAAASKGNTLPAENARLMVAKVVAGKSSFAKCRRTLKETRMILGRAFLAVHSNWSTAHPGCENLLGQPASLNARFGPLQERYYLGQKDHLIEDMLAVRKDGSDLLAKAFAQRR